VPSWQPEWRDVRFDHAACAAAVAACRAAASQLGTASEALEATAGTAAADWTGDAQRRFVDASRVATTDQRALVDDLETLATALAAGARSAEDEQDRRERDRRRWRDERDAEVAAARARREEAAGRAIGGPR
jgi:uncharacterized protein YukE